MDEVKTGADEQQLIGAPYRFEWRGKTILFNLLTEQCIADLVATCKSNAIMEHDDMMMLRYQPPLHPEQLAKKNAEEERFEVRMTTGYFAFGGQGFNSWRQTPKGIRSIIAVVATCGGKELPESDILPLMVEGSDKLGRIVAAVLWDSEFPNVPRPEALNPAKA